MIDCGGFLCLLGNLREVIDNALEQVVAAVKGSKTVGYGGGGQANSIQKGVVSVNEPRLNGE